MCGVMGILGDSQANVLLYDGLNILQHRGQDAAGIVTYSEGSFHVKKGNGLVKEVFDEGVLSELVGNVGIGHVRYPTSGKYSAQEAHPIYVNTPLGLYLAYNGNLTNTAELKTKLIEKYHRHINSYSDSEVLINIFASSLQENMSANTPIIDAVFSAVHKVYELCEGAYSVVILIAGVGMLAFRDPNGIRPLIYGEKGGGYAVASEDTAINAIGYNAIEDFKAGEAILFSTSGEVYKNIYNQSNKLPKTCLFEYIYFARPDSNIDGVSVYNFRCDLGKMLANQLEHAGLNNEIDTVVPVPETSRHSALSLAQHLNLNYKEGLVKNRYVGRTFIMPGQKSRQDSVRRKLSPLKEVFEGKTVLLVDDSIVRGTTSSQIVQMIRNLGAKKVFFASIAPEILYPNVYGIDIPDANTLFARRYTDQERLEIMGVDGIYFQKYEDIEKLLEKYKDKLSGVESSIFTGEYISGNIDDRYLSFLSVERSEQAQERALLEAGLRS